MPRLPASRPRARDARGNGIRLLPARLLQDVVLEVLLLGAHDVAGRVVLADDVEARRGVAALAAGDAAADARRVAPHQLREVGRLLAVARRRAEAVVLALEAPRVDAGAGARVARGEVLACGTALVDNQRQFGLRWWW